MIVPLMLRKSLTCNAQCKSRFIASRPRRSELFLIAVIDISRSRCLEIGFAMQLDVSSDVHWCCFGCAKRLPFAYRGNDA